MVAILEYIALFISLISLSIVAYGSLKTSIAFIKNERQPQEVRAKGISEIRVSLGAYLLLGLELLISADILKTILEPDYKELIILAAVVGIRTIMSIFLNRELKELAE